MRSRNTDPSAVILKLTLALVALILVLPACSATETIVVPTERPTATATATGTPTREPGINVTPTSLPTRAPLTPTGGPSPTPLLGLPVVAALQPTASRTPNPNAPRIEYFTTDVLSVVPGDTVRLLWAGRGADTAAIYRLDPTGNRTQLWNVGPDGQLSVQTSRRDRIQIEFVLSIGEGINRVEQSLIVPLACPDIWFFSPSPAPCAVGPAVETAIIEQPFERGRMLYIASSNRVYALFNDGIAPAWFSIDNRYDPAIHPEIEDSFQPPPGFYQPIRILGFVWRGNDRVRNRLGLALDLESGYQGVVQAAPNGSAETLYISSAGGTVLELLPNGDVWQIITPS
ncbi:MAG: hypothetical protein IH587_01995 [Anaerolineae bacterium]|nr:hypothetical protein [Anaerolineae bacterium]